MEYEWLPSYFYYESLKKRKTNEVIFSIINDPFNKNRILQKTIKLTTERILGLVYRDNIPKLIDELF